MNDELNSDEDLSQDEYLQALLDQANVYMLTMTQTKRQSVITAKGPIDCDALLQIRYGLRENESPAPFDEDKQHDMLLASHEGVHLHERFVNLSATNEYDGSPALAIFKNLSDFMSANPTAMVWTTTLVADGIAKSGDGSPEWDALRERPENKDKTMHDLFRDSAEAQKWLTECLSVFLMDQHGNMIKADCTYSYDDKTHPPLPVFDTKPAVFAGNIFEVPADFIYSQRVVQQFVAFWAALEYSKTILNNN